MPTSSKAELKLKNVSFAYIEDEPVLHNVSLNIEAGATVALVGPTGAGQKLHHQFDRPLL